MELTTSYQKIAEAYVGSSGGDLYVRAYAKYSQQDVANNRTYVHYEATAHFTGSYIYDQQGNGSIGGTGCNTVTGNFSSVTGDITIANTEGWVTHNTDGTKSITVSAKLNFPNWGWSATATGDATLPDLHKPPIIGTAEMTETDATMISLGVPNTTIVQFLSEKTITLHATAQDNATIDSYRLEHYGTTYNIGYQSSNVFNTNYQSNPVTINSSGKAKIIQRVKDNLNAISSDWLMVSIGGTLQEPNGIAYTKPTLEQTSTTIKRKSGNGTNLTDNKANLNVIGTIYKTNDVIGNNNSVTQVGYKVWVKGTSEPANYTNLSPTPSADSSGNVSVSNQELSNIDFTKAYNYKIILKDNYGYDNVIEGTIPLGQPTFSEYKDRVDFLKLTVGGYNPFEYRQGETKCGVWSDGFTEKTLYRKVIDIGSLPNNATKATAHSISSLDMIVSLKGIAVRSSDKDTLPIPYVTFNANNSGGMILNANSTYINVTTSSDRSAYNGYIVIEYTKS